MNKRTCETCRFRSAAPESATVDGQPLYGCRKLNETDRISIRGAHAPWIGVTTSFGCVMWKPRKEAKR